jgi:hypothetical protein
MNAEDSAWRWTPIHFRAYQQALRRAQDLEIIIVPTLLVDRRRL